MVKLLRSLPPETMSTLTWLSSQNPAMGREFLKKLIKSNRQPKSVSDRKASSSDEDGLQSSLQKKSGLEWKNVSKANYSITVPLHTTIAAQIMHTRLYFT